MARSSFIYVVFDIRRTAFPFLAAFTVRRDALAWCAARGAYDRPYMRGVAFPDRRAARPTRSDAVVVTD